LLWLAVNTSMAIPMTAPLCAIIRIHQQGQFFHLRIKARATALKVVFVFPITFGDLRPNFVPRSGTPIEIVSKMIRQHAHLLTTQRYLGKVTEVEAMRWIENLYG